MRLDSRMFLVTATLVSCLGCGEDALSPAADEVRGQVIDTSLDPVPGAVVSAGDHSVRTDSHGRFALPDVAVPYDLLVIPYGRNASLYRGLTRRDPVLLANLGHGFNRSAELRARIPPQQPFEFETSRAFVGRGIEVTLFSGSFIPSTGEIRAFPRWFGPETVAGTLNLLRWKLEAGLPLGEFAVARRQLVLRHGGLHENLDFGPGDFETAGTLRLRGRITPPAGYTHRSRHLGLHLGGTSFNIAYQLDGLGIEDEFEYTVPDFAGATFSVQSRAFQASGSGVRGSYVGVRGLRPGEPEIDVHMPAGLRLLEPQDGAAAVDSSTAFTWEPGGPGLHVLHVVPTESGAPEFTIFLMSNTTLLPARAAWSLALPPSTAYGWHVRHYPATTSIDAVTTRRFFEDYTTDVGMHAFSEGRAFTTN